MTSLWSAIVVLIMEVNVWDALYKLGHRAKNIMPITSKETAGRLSDCVIRELGVENEARQGID